MYKVLAVNDECLTEKVFLDKIALRDTVEFVHMDFQDNLYALVRETEPDIIVISMDSLCRCSDRLLLALLERESHIDCLVIYDNGRLDEAERLKGELTDRYHFLGFDCLDSAGFEIEKIANKIKSDRAKENFEKMLLREADRVKPIIKEQFLKEYIFGIGDTAEVFDIYCQTFNIDAMQSVRMFIFRPESELDFEDMFFLRNIIEGHMGSENLLLSTIVGDCILIIIKVYEGMRVCRLLQNLEGIFDKYYSYKITTVFSGTHPIVTVPRLYERLSKCLEYCFYSRDDHIIFAEDFAPGVNTYALEPNYGAIERAVKSGDMDKVSILLRNFFRDIDKAKVEPALAKTYCLELFVCIIRCCVVEKIDKYMKGIIVLQDFKTLREIKEYVIDIATEIVTANAPLRVRSYSPLISSTMEIIEKNLGNEQLSLRWIASCMLYTNVDYLGKLFKKEVGENFSHYVMEKRMEMAKKLIVEDKKERIYEVAEKVGYGSNSQYFSQVFKKYTGASPLEYKEYARFSAI